jgi:hypothetical protein
MQFFNKQHRFLKIGIFAALLTIYISPAWGAWAKIDSMTITPRGVWSKCQYFYSYTIEVNISNYRCFQSEIWGLGSIKNAYIAGSDASFSERCVAVTQLVDVKKLIFIDAWPGAAFEYQEVIWSVDNWVPPYTVWDMKTITEKAPEPECECKVSINASPSEVWPKGAGNDDKTTSTIMVTATNPPPEGCTVNFKVEPVENSGGHSHHDDSRRKGTVTPPTLTIPAGSLEPVYALYSSSDISGQEKIIAEVNGVKKGETTIQVKVPDLMPLDSLSWYNLTGADAISSHPANHYGTNSTKVAVYNMASDYWNEIRTRLGINDMSLEWGGLFDVNENWSSPHSLHRTGESVDIDRCADGVLVNQKRLDKIALRYDGERIVEEALRPPPCSGPADTPRIHYEF